MNIKICKAALHLLLLFLCSCTTMPYIAKITDDALEIEKEALEEQADVHIDIRRNEKAKL